MSRLTGKQRPDERQARLLLILAASSSFLVVLLGFLIVPAGGSECAKDHECPRGSSCLERMCTPTRPHASAPGPRCKIGRACEQDDDCDELICRDGFLRRESHDPEICESSDVAKFISDIEAKCGNSDTCTPAEFKELLIRNDEFNRLLQESGTSFAIHFDENRPKKFDRGGGSPAWNTTRAEYTRQLAPLMKGISAATSVFLISTASKTRRGGRKSEELSLRRLQEARLLLQEAAKLAGIEKDLRLIDANLGEEWQRDQASYKLLSLSESILWDPKRGVMFEELVEDIDAATSDNSKKERRRLREWRDAVLNQAVFVIPNPCKQPSKSQ